MSDWKAGYRQAMLDYLARNGSPVKQTGVARSYGGWEDYNRWEEVRRHFSGCAVDVGRSGEVRESDWEEFMGTFAQQPWLTKYGVDADLTCSCGQLEGVHMRLDQSPADILQGLLREES
jgi:hypothetical protein